MVFSSPTARPCHPVRLPYLFWLAGPVLILCVLPSARLPAQVASSGARDLLAKADAKLAGGQLLEAERLFRAVLEMDERLCRRCYEGLLQINLHPRRPPQ